jgi:hypothetical protein
MAGAELSTAHALAGASATIAVVIIAQLRARALRHLFRLVAIRSLFRLSCKFVIERESAYRRPRGFQPAGGCDDSSKLISFEPGCTVNKSPEVSFERYQAGVIGLPGGGGPPFCERATESSLAVTVTA